ncbi:short chain dehydrogenase [Vibrio sp. T187]|uniref:short chain dehydrogenase n=1 Tax=Vibrio TaxID=662 RepID=UPI0010C957F5|nr:MULTISPECIES: short chain dehydrogenase [Vibrio]MBW3698278.1 short chain dehydrogenase [Vibrio sp. T187]
MKILAIGSNGVIGNAVVQQLSQEHEVIAVGHSKGELTVNIENQDSIKSLFETVGSVDAIISMAGNGQMGALSEMTDEHFQTVLDNKVMGQVNLVRIGLRYLNHGGSITLTSGEAAFNAMPDVSAISMGTAAINAFVSSVALELTDGKRINAVSPSMVKETMDMWGIDSSTGIPANDVASYYQASLTSEQNGHVYRAIHGAYQVDVKPAYLIASSLYPDGHPSLIEYAQACGPIFKAHGAEPVVVGNTNQTVNVIEQDWPNQDAKVSVVKFPSMQHLLDCFSCEGYQSIKHLRTDAISTKFTLAVE